MSTGSNGSHAETTHAEPTRDGELEYERHYVSVLYGKLDAQRAEANDRLAVALRETGGTHQARLERDVSTAMYNNQLASLSAAENGLCFGRLDFDDDTRQYIGRLGLFDERNDYEPLLLDWRAPAAQPFYCATAAAPQGVRRRRHLRTRRRTVVGLDDEVLDLAAVDAGGHEGLAGEAALLAALNAQRTGRMADIVQTIQGEQDRIIRSGLSGVLVVEGGPGTGKTAVALHRAAYLLYTHRRQLSKRGVLVIGPNATFLRYIGQVLPSLGETSALLATVGEMYPGLTATGMERAEVAAVKGNPAMADVLVAAVKDRQELPKEPLEIPFEQDILTIDRAMCSAARTRARRSRRPHNLARPIFVQELLRQLAEQVAGRLGRELLDPADLDDIRAELRDDQSVRAALSALWPHLTPMRLLADLFGSAERRAVAGKKLTPADRDLLARGPEADWTPADVPLLDEVAELLGEDDSEERAREAQRQQDEVDYAQGVLDILGLQDEADPEILFATDLLDAERLAGRHEHTSRDTTAERAAADRTWTFGHVIVDEAQELSAMAWRMVMRRCPSRSMTLVGDLAQTGDLSGARSWRDALRPFVADRWRLERLTVNYRTPAEIMAVASDVLHRLDDRLAPPTSVRDAGIQPWHREVPAEEFADRLVAAIRQELAAIRDGRLAVLVPAARLAELGPQVTAQIPDSAIGEQSAGLDAPTVLLTVGQVKGLEFDSVLLADPAGIVTESARGLSNLYVALTRATQRLGVLHTGELPDVLARLATAAL